MRKPAPKLAPKLVPLTTLHPCARLAAEAGSLVLDVAAAWDTMEPERRFRVSLAAIVLARQAYRRPNSLRQTAAILQELETAGQDLLDHLRGGALPVPELWGAA